MLCTPVSSADRFFRNWPYPKEMDPQLTLVGPSRVQVGEVLDLQIVATGMDGELALLDRPPVATCQGPKRPGVADEREEPAVDFVFQEIAKGIYRPSSGPVLDRPGYYLLTARDPANMFLPCGLPICVSEAKPALQLHWADLHGHSSFSDGARAPEEYYRWARDVARLDAMALTDHNWALNDAKIERLRELAKAWYVPGRFVPIFAFEWAPGLRRPAPSRGRPDHKDLYFQNVDESLGPWEPEWLNTPSVARLWDMLAGREVVAIPHHTGLPHATYFGTDWDQHDVRFERLVEVFSDFGSSETAEDRYALPEGEPGRFVRDVLEKGLHLGMVGGSDNHNSRPGLNTMPLHGHPYPLTSLTAIEAATRTRDDIWTALYDRRCYAASAGRRPLLEVAVNDAPMGSRIIEPFRCQPRRIAATVAGSAEIREILIVKNGKVAMTFPGTDWCQRIEWTDADPSPDREDSYYVRAEMADTSMAWSSPVWVAGPKDSDIAAEPRLWRLDGDVSGRSLQTLTAEANAVTPERPLVLCNLQGPGAVDRVLIEAKANTNEQEEAIRSTTLAVWIDGRPAPDIRACLDQLCFVAMGGRPFATRGVSFSITERADGRWLTFSRDLRIPFAESCRVELRPPPGVILDDVRSSLTCGLWKDGRLPALGRMGRCVVPSLRNQSVTGTGTEVELLNIQGRGLLHSLQMAMRNPDTGGQYMEGNIEIFVDGETRPSYASSGTEEFFFGGIYFINPFWTPSGGCTLSIHEPGNSDRRSSAYRVFEKDPVTFDESIRVVWHNGQHGQGDVPGTTILDAQSVVYLQRPAETPAEPTTELLRRLTRRINLLDGAPELGPIVTDRARIARLAPGDAATLCDVRGAGHLSRAQFVLTGQGGRCDRARLVIVRDGQTICDEPLAALCGGGDHGFAAGFVGKTGTPPDRVHVQRELLVPYREALVMRLVANEESGAMEGLALLERRQAPAGLPADFGPAQAPLLAYREWTADGQPSPLRLSVPETTAGGQVRELSISFTGLPRETTALPVELRLVCDGDLRARWTPAQLVPGLDWAADGAVALPDAVSLRDADSWQALVSFRDRPFSFDKEAALEIDPTRLPAGVRLAAHLLASRFEPGRTATDADALLAQRLNALDGGVLAGRSICRTVLEDGDIDPGQSETLLELAGNGTLRCIRIGTPFSAGPLGRSRLEIITSTTDETPALDASTEQFFATWFDPFPSWRGADDLVRPTQLHHEDGSRHTSAFRLLSFPFHGRCRVRLAAPADDGGAMAWLREHLPATRPRTALRDIVDLPADVREGLQCSACVGLFVQVYANRLDRLLDWGRWEQPRHVAAEGQSLAPGESLCLAELTGRGALRGLQMAFENSESDRLRGCSLEVFVDGESSPSWVVPSIDALFLGTPVPGSGEGTQRWSDAATRSRDACGEGNRLLSAEAGTTICTADAPYRLAGYRRFTRAPITFERSIRVVCRHPPGGDAPTRVWALLRFTMEDAIPPQDSALPRQSTIDKRQASASSQ